MLDIKEEIIKATKEAGCNLPDDFSLSSPPKKEMGDLATNIAILISKKEGLDPVSLGKKIAMKIKSPDISSAEVVSPGFINIKLSQSYYYRSLSSIISFAGDYGRSDIGQGKNILIEFVSANPTGPLHIGNARGGPIGEVISNVLSWLGYDVQKEFYVNDIGSQIKKFGQTLAYYYIVKNDPNYHFPEGGYPGSFLQEVSLKIQKKYKEEISKLKDEDLVDFFIRHGLEITLRQIKDDLSNIGIEFDRFQYESDFVNSGKSQQIINELSEKKAIVDREGAIWFSSKEYSDLNDRESVLVRSDSEKSLTYFTNDIAYHKEKFDRKFSKLINIWGPNHHGHVIRLKAALDALGYNSEKLTILLYQNVKLKEGGIIKQMGKRLGNFVNITDLIEKMKVPADVFKYVIISQSSQNIINFDLDLALEQSEKNPVFYLQYAYARICSILRNADKEILTDIEKKIQSGREVILPDLEFLADEREINLIAVLQKFPEILKNISENFQVQALPFYANEIARAYSDFYTNCRVLSDDNKLTTARLYLIIATRNVLKISFSLMGITAPEKM